MKEYTKEPRKPCEAAQESLPEDMIEGRNAVTEALRSGRTINKVFLADGDTTLTGADLRGPAAIVIGNEGSGMSRLVAESCDLKVSIPLKGHISSLNASTAAAVLLYEAVRQRG